MSKAWSNQLVKSESDFENILLDLKGKRWWSRGQASDYGSLVPSIDRGKRAGLSRGQKLRLERQSISVFRATARFFAGTGEQNALIDDFVALMVLRHYGVPTRLLDWSASPHVAAYFCVSSQDENDGEIWAFDPFLYKSKGEEQWTQWPQTTNDGSGSPEHFDANLTAFTVEEPCDWFIAALYPEGFPRQNAQSGLYSLTARFGRCHADAIIELLREKSACRRYVIKRDLKPRLRTVLRERYGIWQGSLFPDSAGAAYTAARTAFPDPA